MVRYTYGDQNKAISQHYVDFLDTIFYAFIQISP